MANMWVNCIESIECVLICRGNRKLKIFSTKSKSTSSFYYLSFVLHASPHYTTSRKLKNKGGGGGVFKGGVTHIPKTSILIIIMIIK